MGKMVGDGAGKEFDALWMDVKENLRNLTLRFEAHLVSKVGKT
jgi:hypothetical protein